jgi:hypothetical protein
MLFVYEKLKYFYLFGMFFCSLTLDAAIYTGLRSGKRPLGRPRRRWEDNIKTSSGSGMRGYGLDWAGSGKGQVVSTCECGNEPSGSVKCGEFLD